MNQISSILTARMVFWYLMWYWWTGFTGSYTTKCFLLFLGMIWFAFCHPSLPSFWRWVFQIKMSPPVLGPCFLLNYIWLFVLLEKWQYLKTCLSNTIDIWFQKATWDYPAVSWEVRIFFSTRQQNFSSRMKSCRAAVGKCISEYRQLVTECHRLLTEYHRLPFVVLRSLARQEMFFQLYQSCHASCIVTFYPFQH